MVSFMRVTLMGGSAIEAEGRRDGEMQSYLNIDSLCLSVPQSLHQFHFTWKTSLSVVIVWLRTLSLIVTWTS
jgi:hypothetical protein